MSKLSTAIYLLVVVTHGGCLWSGCLNVGMLRLAFVTQTTVHLHALYSHLGSPEPFLLEQLLVIQEFTRHTHNASTLDPW